MLKKFVKFKLSDTNPTAYLLNNVLNLTTFKNITSSQEEVTQKELEKETIYN